MMMESLYGEIKSNLGCQPSYNDTKSQQVWIIAEKFSLPSLGIEPEDQCSNHWARVDSLMQLFEIDYNLEATCMRNVICVDIKVRVMACNIMLGAKSNMWVNANHLCPDWESNKGCQVGSLTLYHVTIKAGLYRNVDKLNSRTKST